MNRLRREAWAEQPGRGPHVKFTRDGRMVIVPNHPGDLRTGTLRAIYRDAGWPWPIRP
jgi:predicted RNA binding protein YcfA (HicA-like mRNA interferase family)